MLLLLSNKGITCIWFRCDYIF